MQREKQRTRREYASNIYTIAEFAKRKKSFMENMQEQENIKKAAQENREYLKSSRKEDMVRIENRVRKQNKKLKEAELYQVDSADISEEEWVRRRKAVEDKYTAKNKEDIRRVKTEYAKERRQQIADTYTAEKEANSVQDKLYQKQRELDNPASTTKKSRKTIQTEQKQFLTPEGEKLSADELVERRKGLKTSNKKPKSIDPDRQAAIEEKERQAAIRANERARQKLYAKQLHQNTPPTNPKPKTSVRQIEQQNLKTTAQIERQRILTDTKQPIVNTEYGKLYVEKRNNALGQSYTQEYKK